MVNKINTMIKYIALILILSLFGCKEEEKEPPFEWVTFYPLIEKPVRGTSAIEVYGITMKKYYNESIGQMIERNHRKYGTRLIGKWEFEGVVIDFEYSYNQQPIFFADSGGVFNTAKGFMISSIDTLYLPYSKIICDTLSKNF